MIQAPKMRFQPAAELVAELVSDQFIAQNAADDRATGQIFRLKIKDEHAPYITLGHMLVVVLCGSEEALQVIYRAVRPLVTEDNVPDKDIEG